MLDFSGKPNVITRVHIRGRERPIRLRERFEDATLALKMEREATSQGRRAGSLPGPPERNAALLTDTLI